MRHRCGAPNATVGAPVNCRRFVKADGQRCPVHRVLYPPEPPVTAEQVAHFWSEWTDDAAPLHERGVYLFAARDFLRRYDVTPKEPS